MCQRCVDAIQKYFPDCPDDKVGDFLMASTAFPFGNAETIERQLRAHKEAGCTTWESAMARTDELVREAMDSVPPE